jgi:hypothetical protein
MTFTQTEYTWGSRLSSQFLCEMGPLSTLLIMQLNGFMTVNQPDDRYHVHAATFWCNLDRLMCASV